MTTDLPYLDDSAQGTPVATAETMRLIIVAQFAHSSRSMPPSPAVSARNGGTLLDAISREDMSRVNSMDPEQLTYIARNGP